MKSITKLYLLISFMAVCTSVTNAQFKSFALTNSEIQKYYPSSTESFSSGSSDGTIICWMEDSMGGSIITQKLSSNGDKAWSSNGVIVDSGLGTTFTADTDYPIAFSDGSGGGIFIYRKNNEIMAARIYSSGFPARSPLVLSSRYEGLNYHPKAEQADDFSVIICWENFTMGDFNIHAQKISRECFKLWQRGDEVVICDDPADQRKPEIAVTHQGESIFTWLDTRNIWMPDSASYDIYGSVYDKTGAFTGEDQRGTLLYKQRLSGTLLNRVRERRNSTSIKASGSIEKEVDYSHNPVVSGQSVYIAIDEKSELRSGQLTLLTTSLKLEKISERIIEERGINVSPVIISGTGRNLIIIWKRTVFEGNHIMAIGINENGKTMHGLNNGMVVSCDSLKGATKRSLSISNMPAVYSSSTRNLCLPWVAGTGGQLFINELSLTDESEVCTRVQMVNHGLTSTEHTSVTTQAGTLVIVYNLAQDIFVSVRDLPKDPKHHSFLDGRIANYPNPFNPTTTINYTVPSDGFVRLSIFDVAGKEIAVIVNGFRQKGDYEALFDGRDMATGFYVYRLETGGKSISGKMMMIK